MDAAGALTAATEQLRRAEVAVEVADAASARADAAYAEASFTFTLVKGAKPFNVEETIDVMMDRDAALKEKTVHAAALQTARDDYDDCISIWRDAAYAAGGGEGKRLRRVQPWEELAQMQRDREAAEMARTPKLPPPEKRAVVDVD